jgi:FtsP/CotA-like multicopper oxidase with cupredoxin domain
MPQQGSPQATQAQPPRAVPTGIIQVVHLDAVKHAWEISPGIIVHGYGYNEQVPGPTLEASVGDTLFVRFTNSLLEPTSICWHGPGSTAEIDRTEHAAAAVQPGGTLEYQLELTDAGTFWYHAVIDDRPQSASGLYGALLVRDPAEPGFDSEQVLVFGDSTLIVLNGSTVLTPVPERGGHREEHMLLNGVLEPQILLTAGHRERWRLVNATATRLRLSLSGHRMTVIGTLGTPLSAPVEVDEVALGPGECRDLVAGPFTADQRLVLRALSVNGRGTSIQRRVATLHVAGP